MRDFIPGAKLGVTAKRRDLAAAVSAAALFLASTACAQAADAPPAPEPGICDASPSITSTVAIPVAGDAKKYLCDHGINFQVNYIGEVYGNPTGGIKQNARYEHRVELGLDADLNKLVGIPGLTFHVNGYEIAGQSVTTYNLLNLSTISNIAAHPAFLLFELWAEQKLFDDKLAIRIGQLAADSEFFISDFGSMFTNAAFGWPTILAVDLPSGGPAYPFATPAVRIKYSPFENVSLMAAVFNGDPTGAGFDGDPYQMDKSGTAFRLKDAPLVMAEAAISYNQGRDSTGLAGTVKFGGWNHFGDFFDQRFGTGNVPLAAPFSTGDPIVFGGDWGLYGIIDQMLWRLPGDDPRKGVGFFARVAGAPTDRNEISFYVDGGFTFMGLWGQRPDDSFGLGVTYAEISPAAHGFDLDTAAFAGENIPARNYEVAVELTYNAQIIPGFNIQPVFTYVFHPGAGAVNPLDPARPAGRSPTPPCSARGRPSASKGRRAGRVDDVAPPGLSLPPWRRDERS